RRLPRSRGHRVSARATRSVTQFDRAAMHQAEPLWRLVIGQLRTHPSASHPSGQDRPRIRWGLWEPDLLGQRPTPAEISDGGGTDWSRALADLWRERLREPCRNIRGSGWRHPSLWPLQICVEYGLEPIELRLEREVIRTARALSDAIARADCEA